MEQATSLLEQTKRSASSALNSGFLLTLLGRKHADKRVKKLRHIMWPGTCLGMTLKPYRWNIHSGDTLQGLIE